MGCLQAKAGRGITWMAMEDTEGFRGGTRPCPFCAGLTPMKASDIAWLSEWLCLQLPQPQFPVLL